MFMAYLEKGVTNTSLSCEMPSTPGWEEVVDMTRETEESKRAWTVGGVFIPAGLFIGMGIGWALGYLVPGMFVGLGAGLLGMALAVAFIRPKAG